MSDLKFVIDAKKLAAFIQEATAEGTIEGKIEFEVDFVANATAIVPTMKAKFLNPLVDGLEGLVGGSPETTVDICPTPPGCS